MKRKYIFWSHDFVSTFFFLKKSSMCALKLVIDLHYKKEVVIELDNLLCIYFQIFQVKRVESHSQMYIMILVLLYSGVISK